jgi:hypothetical protein
MGQALQPRGRGGAPSPSGLADVIDTILDKGLVIDAYLRVSLVGIEVLTIDARVVVASVDTYLRFAEAVSRLDISKEKAGLPELISGSGSGSGGKGRKSSGKTRMVKGMLEGVGDVLREFAEAEGQRGSRRPGR